MSSDEYLLYGSFLRPKQSKHKTEELRCVLMGSEEFQRENRRPRKKPFSEKANPAMNLKHDVAELLEQIAEIVTGSEDDYTEYMYGIEGPHAKGTEATSFIHEQFELPIDEPEAVLRERTDTPISTTKHERLTAYLAGNIGLSYLRGLLEYKRMNLEDAILHLTRCYELAIQADSFKYVMKSQVQLAVLHLERYQEYEIEEDYRLALRYSINLMRMD